MIIVPIRLSGSWCSRYPNCPQHVVAHPTISPVSNDHITHTPSSVLMVMIPILSPQSSYHGIHTTASSGHSTHTLPSILVIILSPVFNSYVPILFPASSDLSTSPQQLIVAVPIISPASKSTIPPVSNGMVPLLSLAFSSHSTYTFPSV